MLVIRVVSALCLGILIGCGGAGAAHDEGGTATTSCDDVVLDVTARWTSCFDSRQFGPVGGSSSLERPDSLAYAADGSIFIVGTGLQLLDPDSGNNGWVRRLAPDGTLLWDTFFELSGPRSFGIQGDALLLGGGVSPTDSGVRAYLRAVTPDGSVVDDWTHDFTDVTGVTGLVVGPDGVHVSFAHGLSAPAKIRHYSPEGALGETLEFEEVDVAQLVLRGDGEVVAFGAHDKFRDRRPWAMIVSGDQPKELSVEALGWDPAIGITAATPADDGSITLVTQLDQEIRRFKLDAEDIVTEIGAPIVTGFSAFEGSKVAVIVEDDSIWITGTIRIDEEERIGRMELRHYDAAGELTSTEPLVTGVFAGGSSLVVGADEILVGLDGPAPLVFSMPVPE